MKLIAHFQRFWHQVSSTSHNLQDTQPIVLGYSYLIKLNSLYKQGKSLAVMGTFSLVMRGLKECMSEMQSKYWLPLLIRALLRPFWWCHNLNFDRSKFRLLPAVCPSDMICWMQTSLSSDVGKLWIFIIHWETVLMLNTSHAQRSTLHVSD